MQLVSIFAYVYFKDVTAPLESVCHAWYIKENEINQARQKEKKEKPEDHWSCNAHLIAEDMLKSAVIEEKTFKHSPWAGAGNPLGPKF